MEGAVISTTTLEPAQRELVLPHWHAQIELIRVLAGTLSCTVNGVERRVGAGSICMINRGQIHRIVCADTEPCTVQTLMIDPSLLTGDRVLRERAIDPMLDDERFTHAISSSQHALTREVANLMDTIAELTAQRPDAYELAVVAFLHLIFQKLCCLRHALAGAYAEQPADALIYRKMVAFIYERYAQRLTLADIAAAGNVGRSKCSDIFTRYARHTPIELLNLHRLETAAHLLRHSDDDIGQIALACGFSQQSYFNRRFLVRYGMPPRAWRRAVHAKRSAEEAGTGASLATPAAEPERYPR